MSEDNTTPREQLETVLEASLADVRLHIGPNAREMAERGMLIPLTGAEKRNITASVLDAIDKAGGKVLMPVEKTSVGGVYVNSDVMFRALSDDGNEWEPMFRGEDRHITYVSILEPS